MSRSIKLAPLRTTWAGKITLASRIPLPARFEAVADMISERRSGVVLRHTITGVYVLWTGVGNLQSLPYDEIVAALGGGR